MIDLDPAAKISRLATELQDQDLDLCRHDAVMQAMELIPKQDTTMTDLDKLRGFANELLDEWPEGGSFDMGDLQDAAIKHGLLELKTPAPTEPCCEGCFCAEYVDNDEWAAGVDCYRKAALLKEVA